MAWGTDLTHEDVTAIVDRNNDLVREIHELTVKSTNLYSAVLDMRRVLGMDDDWSGEVDKASDELGKLLYPPA